MAPMQYLYKNLFNLYWEFPFSIWKTVSPASAKMYHLNGAYTIYIQANLLDIHTENSLPRNSNTRNSNHQTLCWKLYQRGLGPPIVVVCGLYGVINWN